MAAGNGHKLPVVSARLHPKTLAALVQRAETERTTRDEIIRRAVVAYVEEQVPTEPAR